MNLRKALSGWAAMAAVLALAGCSWQPARSATLSPSFPSDPGAMTVTAGENFYGDVLHQLGGPRLRIYSFLSDPNADPHQYESNPGDARVVADSRLVLENGLGYDAFLDRLVKASPRSDRIVLNVQRLTGAADGSNPHLWYEPAVMPKVARAVVDALVALDPAGGDAYRSGLDRFLGSLEPLQGQVRSMRARFQGYPVAFTEPVYGYMADAIGLDVRSPERFMKAVEEGNDPPTSATAQEQDLLSHRQVRVLIYNSQATTKVTSSIKELARRSSIPVVSVSETEPPGTTFQEWQLSQLRALERALEQAA